MSRWSFGGVVMQMRSTSPRDTVSRQSSVKCGIPNSVAVVRALINKPKLLLADEPTGALDRASAEELARLLVELNREENVTLIVVTHALDLARQMARVLELRDGRLAPAIPSTK